MNWAIYARQAFRFSDDGPETIVAVFTAYGDAKEYIIRSKLKRKRFMRYWKCRSLLAGYGESVRVAGYKVQHPPLNPEINWK